MLRVHRLPICVAAIAAAIVATFFASTGVPRPLPDWHWIDIAGETSMALMACVWFLVVLSNRPAGRVTTLLAGGLACVMLGAWADLMDEFFMIAKGLYWNHLLESGVTIAGMACLTWGLIDWRQEHLMVSEHPHKRERLLREHPSFDPLTQVGDADYLREQLRIEHDCGTTCALMMLDLDSFHLVNRDYGQREGDRLLQAVPHLLLMNLRNSDLLCRYAGDRFAILLPGADADTARSLGQQLCRALASLRHYPRSSGPAIALTARCVARAVDTDPRSLLKDLNRALERRVDAQGLSAARA